MRILQVTSAALIKDCADVWLESSIAAHGFVTRQYWEKQHGDMLEQYLPAATVFAAESAGRVVGFSATCGDTLAALFCLPSCWGRGAGSALLRHLFNRHDRLELAVYAKNTRALAFYVKHGFECCSGRICAHTGEKEWLMLWKKDASGSA